MSKKKFDQQGDVVIKRVQSIPEGTKKVAPVAGRFILAEGEATGHAHAIAATPNISLVEKDGTLYLNVEDEKGVVVHEEHKPVVLDPGKYEVGQVVEHDPLSKEINRVRD